MRTCAMLFNIMGKYSLLYNTVLKTILDLLLLLRYFLCAHFDCEAVHSLDVLAWELCLCVTGAQRKRVGNEQGYLRLLLAVCHPARTTARSEEHKSEHQSI